MRLRISLTGVAAITALGFTAARAADPSAGRQLFRERCTVCHSAESGDGGGAQGPSLAGLLGRHAASAPGFNYTAALRTSNLTWDRATLSRFLAAPTDLVPGTSMAQAVSDSTERDNLIAYLAGVEASRAAGPPRVPSASRHSANWRLDAPGRSHRIEVAALPAPFATPSTRNNTTLAPRPAGAQLKVPRGFRVTSFASDLAGPRKMLVAPNGDVFVTETQGGRVSVLHPSSDGDHAARREVYAEGLHVPFGIAFYPNAKQPEWLYVAETHQVVRFAYHVGDVNAHGVAEIVVPLPAGSGHVTRDIAFSADGKKLYVSVGSQSNVAESMSKKSAADIQAWDAEHGLGAAWDAENRRAMVLAYDALSPAEPTPYATGIRNCVSLTLQPQTNALWCTTNERDLLGDDLVPDYSTRMAPHSFFGWPWYYLGSHQDPRLAGERPDLDGKVAVPDVLYQAHSAALSMTFYLANQGSAAFPKEYAGDAFVGLHGSWNRSLRTGYKLVRVRMKDGEPTGAYEDFLTGFIINDDSVWGRPVATAQLADGSLLMSEDGGNNIYRIAYRR